MSAEVRRSTETDTPGTGKYGEERIQWTMGELGKEKENERRRKMVFRLINRRGKEKKERRETERKEIYREKGKKRTKRKMHKYVYVCGGETRKKNNGRHTARG